MIDIFDLKYRFVPTQTQTTFCCSVTQSCLALSTPRTAACQASLSFTELAQLMSFESVMLFTGGKANSSSYHIGQISPAPTTCSCWTNHSKDWILYDKLISLQVSWRCTLTGEVSLRDWACVCVTQHLNHSPLKWNPLFFHVSISEEFQNWFKASNDNAQQTWLHLSQSLPNHLSQGGFCSPIHHVHSLQRRNEKGGKGQMTLFTFSELF